MLARSDAIRSYSNQKLAGCMTVTFLIIPNRLMQRLNNSKMLMKVLLNQITIMHKERSKSDLKMTIRLIRDDLKDIDKENQEFMIEIDKYRGLKPANKAVTEALKRSSKMMSAKALKQNAKVAERMLNKMMSFDRPNPRSNYEQGENNNPQKNRQIQNQNNRTDPGTRHNDENAQVPVPPEAWTSEPKSRTKSRLSTPSGGRFLALSFE